MKEKILNIEQFIKKSPTKSKLNILENWGNVLVLLEGP
jgi:hypothetical protein